MNNIIDFTVIVGKELPNITGKLVINPESINDFEEDDIIVLPNSGFQFDHFSRKATKNGKGAVIVEVGNKVQHLAVVARESNRRGVDSRLILLPNAINLLSNQKTIKISTLEQQLYSI
jgi:hypothetical protein